jgi:hypothetical protein
MVLPGLAWVQIEPPVKAHYRGDRNVSCDCSPFDVLIWKDRCQ